MLFYLRLWEGSDQFVYLLTILEEKKSGDALDTVLEGIRFLVPQWLHRTIVPLSFTFSP